MSAVVALGMLLLLFVVVLPSPVSAAVNCGDNVAILKEACQGDKNPIINLLVIFIKFMSVGVGLAVAGGIIWGGMLYGTARGNSGQTQKAVTVIVNSVVGLILYIFMFALLNFLIPGGVLS